MGEIARSKSRIASDLKTRDSNRWRLCDLKLRFETRDWRFVLINTPIQQKCEKGCDLSPRSKIASDWRLAICPSKGLSGPRLERLLAPYPYLTLSKNRFLRILKNFLRIFENFENFLRIFGPNFLATFFQNSEKIRFFSEFLGPVFGHIFPKFWKIRFFSEYLGPLLAKQRVDNHEIKNVLGKSRISGLVPGTRDPKPAFPKNLLRLFFASKIIFLFLRLFFKKRPLRKYPLKQA